MSQPGGRGRPPGAAEPAGAPADAHPLPSLDNQETNEAMGGAHVPACRRRPACRREGDRSSNKQQHGRGAERNPATALLKGE